MRDGLWHRPRLLALCIGLPLAEAVACAVFHIPGGPQLGPQASAPAPFDVFHDLRWLLVYSRSWPTFAVESAVMLAGRSALTAAIVRAAWPAGGAPRPGFSVAFRRAVAFDGIAAALLAPWALLMFGMAAVSLSWLFFTAVPATLVIALLIHHGSVTGRWWRQAPPARAVLLMLAAFVWLMLAAAVAGASPEPLHIPAVAAAGLVNALLWRRMVGLVASRVEPIRFRPVAPIGVVAMFVVAAGGAGIAFRIVTNRARVLIPAQHTDENGEPVLVAAGFESQWDGRPMVRLGRGFYEVPFSYRGLGPDGRPLPYAGADTAQPVPRLAASMYAQVKALHARTDRPVAIVAESEGVVVTNAYLHSHPGAPVDRVVLLSPLGRTGQAYYPRAGSDGWGMVAAWGLRGLSAAVRLLSPFDLSPDNPLIRSLVERDPRLGDALSCPLEGIRQLTVLPMADAVTGPSLTQRGGSLLVVAAFHGGLLGDRHIRGQVRSFLDGKPLASSPGALSVERLFSAVSSAWRVPGLPVALRPSDALGGCGSR